MNEVFLEQATNKVGDIRLLINGIPLRVHELARGGKPLITVMPGEHLEWLDVALQEIAEGKVEILPRSEKE